MRVQSQIHSQTFQATVEPLPGMLNVWKLDAGIKNSMYWPYWSQSVPPSTVVERKKSPNESSALPFSFPVSLSVRDVTANPLPLCYSHECFSIDACIIFAPISHFFSDFTGTNHQLKPPSALIAFLKCSHMPHTSLWIKLEWQRTCICAK